MTEFLLLKLLNARHLPPSVSIAPYGILLQDKTQVNIIFQIFNS